jgi:hypothetical protein
MNPDRIAPQALAWIAAGAVVLVIALIVAFS